MTETKNNIYACITMVVMIMMKIENIKKICGSSDVSI